MAAAERAQLVTSYTSPRLAQQALIPAPSLQSVSHFTTCVGSHQTSLSASDMAQQPQCSMEQGEEEHGSMPHSVSTRDVWQMSLLVNSAQKCYGP